MARPSPFSRPALFLISDNPRWPKITAATKAHGTKNRSPNTRLAMAFPLVCAGAAGTNGPTLAGAGTAEDCAPHLRQNWSSLPMLLPHCVQNVLMDSSQSYCAWRIKFARNILFAMGCVNALDQFPAICPGHVGLICCPQWSRPLD